MSLFSILGTGASGLAAAQQALDVIAQNVANSDTPGYSRQRVDEASLQSTPSPGLYTGYHTTLSGVTVTTVERVKNEFLQASATSAAARQSALQSQVDPLNDVQSQMNEPSDNGLQSTLNTFYNAWGDLTNDPSSSTGRASGIQVIGTGQAVTNQLNTLSYDVSEEWKNQHLGLVSAVSQANSAATSVADLNQRIRAGQTGGVNVNDLLDERDRDVTSLATLVGGVATTGSDGQVSVSISGVQIVADGNSETLTVGGGGDLSTAATDPPTLSVGAVAVNPSLGQAAGLLSSLRTDLPSISAGLDGIADALRDAVNSLSNSGYTLSGAQGTDFFSGTGAADLAVAATSPDDLAVSSSAGAVDGSNAAKIANLINDNNSSAALGGAPGPSVRYRALTAQIATQVQGLNTALKTQTSIVASTQSAVDSDSGVSLDEELTNMLLYQHSYEASAKVVTTADQMLQTLIGMVS